VKQAQSRHGNVRVLRSRPRIPEQESAGILVQEEELSLATAQHMYRMRCECGRSWFELELKTLVSCPACLRLNRVHLA
jgi:hypothetical protein